MERTLQLLRVQSRAHLRVILASCAYLQAMIVSFICGAACIWFGQQPAGWACIGTGSLLLVLLPLLKKKQQLALGRIRHELARLVVNLDLDEADRIARPLMLRQWEAHQFADYI